MQTTAVTAIYHLLILSSATLAMAATPVPSLPAQTTPKAIDSPIDEVVSVDPDPEDFPTPPKIDNPFFPLTPGTTFVYEGETDGVPARTEFTITHQTKVIQGITTVVIDDKDFVNGVKDEETHDWYAQDLDGNVWYFGEATDQLDPSGKVIGHQGSWEAGKNGAHAGVVMEGNPKSLDTYFQEFAPGQGEDRAVIRSLDTTVTVPFGRFTDCLKTKEFSRLDPGVFEQKYYARGVGLLKSAITVGGNEHFVLVTITKGN